MNLKKGADAPIFLFPGGWEILVAISPYVGVHQ